MLRGERVGGALAPAATFPSDVSLGRRRREPPPRGADGESAVDPEYWLRLRRAHWMRYGALEAMAGLRVEDLHQDERGFVRIATADAGLLRFDGARFDVFGPERGLPDSGAMAGWGT